MAEEGTESSAYLAYMAADSSNVDESGNFSVEVLATCLRNFNLELINIASPQCANIRNNLLEQTGFICNLQSHWLALRKLGGRWWNLNSLQADNVSARARLMTEVLSASLLSLYAHSPLHCSIFDVGRVGPNLRRRFLPRYSDQRASRS